MIPSAYRTIFFHAVGRRLEQRGHDIYWLSPNRRWGEWLIRRGVARQRILDATVNGPAWHRRGAPSVDELQALSELEARGTLCVNNIIAMDPLLRQRSWERAIMYLAACERAVRRFLEENGIGLVLAEQTWAFELLVGQVCATLGVGHLIPHTIRIPDPRFAFFRGPFEAELLQVGGVNEDHVQAAGRALGDFRAHRPRPSYMAVNRNVLRPNVRRIRTLARHLAELAGDPFDETSLRPAQLVVEHGRQLIRSILVRRGVWRVGEQAPSGRPYVLFPLHKQPEASIDVKGSPFTSQVEIVRALARTLPVTHDLYVKEHPIAVSTRSRAFYRDIAGIPGVRIISPFADSFDLVRGADLVVTITGTAAYEAALLGRPAATIAPVFFDRVVAVRNFDPFADSLARLLHNPSAAVPKSDEDLLAFLAWLIGQSFPGLVGDAFWQPESLEDYNIELVTEGFETLIRCGWNVA